MGKFLKKAAVFLALLPGAALAQETQSKGFVELRASGFVGVDGKPWQTVERFRPTITYKVSDRVLLTSTIELGLAQGRTNQAELQRTLEASDFGPLLLAAGCSWPSPTNSLLNVDSARDYLDVDRLHFDLYLPQVDLRIGRQALQWGSGQFFNPTDPFPQALFAEPWRPRRGVNAVLATVPFGGLSDAQVVLGANDALTSARAAARLRTNWKGTDFALIGAYRGDVDDGLVGLDIRGTLGVGFWFEGALHLDEEPYEELVVGLDYSFPLFNSFLIMAQYYRNGSGATHPDDYDVVGSIGTSVTPPTCTGADVSTLFGDSGDPNPFAPVVSARDYAMLTLAVTFSRDFSLSGAWVQNLNDGTGIAVPTLTASPNGWLQVSLSGQLPLRVWGEGGEFSPRAEDLRISQPLGTTELTADFSGLVPDATVILWTRFNY